MKFIIPIIFILGSFNFLHAEDDNKSKKIKRSVKRRVKEEVCLKGKVKCLTIKRLPKMKESSETIKDSTKDAVNKID
ncbi:MAG: hypothetical protein WC635_11200 [Bacteriovorax sp.]|jgi:hypothetical protein